MSFRIDDGGGKNGFARVSNNQRLDVSARAAPRQYYESRDEGQVYSAIASDTGAVANEETLYIKNTSTTKDMVIDDILISPDTASTWQIKFVTGTATGTAITAVNFNKASSNSAAVEIKGGAGGVTGLTDAGNLGIIRTGANTTIDFAERESLRLGQDDAIAVECKTSCNVHITVLFHYDSE